MHTGKVTAEDQGMVSPDSFLYGFGQTLWLLEASWVGSWQMLVPFLGISAVCSQAGGEIGLYGWQMAFILGLRYLAPLQAQKSVIHAEGFPQAPEP